MCQYQGLCDLNIYKKGNHNSGKYNKDTQFIMSSYFPWSFLVAKHKREMHLDERTISVSRRHTSI